MAVSLGHEYVMHVYGGPACDAAFHTAMAEGRTGLLDENGVELHMLLLDLLCHHALPLLISAAQDGELRVQAQSGTCARADRCKRVCLALPCPAQAGTTTTQTTQTPAPRARL